MLEKLRNPDLSPCLLTLCTGREFIAFWDVDFSPKKTGILRSKAGDIINNDGYGIHGYMDIYIYTWICLRGAQKIKHIHYRFPKWWIFHWENKKSP